MNNFKAHHKAEGIEFFLNGKSIGKYENGKRSILSLDEDGKKLVDREIEVFEYNASHTMDCVNEHKKFARIAKKYRSRMD